MDRRYWIALVCCGSIAACSRSEPNQANLPALATQSGLRFPPSSQLLFEQESLTDKSGLWMIRAEERFELPGEKELTDANAVRLEMDKHLKGDVIGEISDGIAINNRWRANNLRYRGAVIRSSKGFFLRLERFAQP
jgi:hypothetical protein